MAITPPPPRVAGAAFSGGSPPFEPREPLRLGPLEIYPAEFQVLAAGRRVGLTVREFQVFLVLAERCDRVVTRAEIYDRVWRGTLPHRDRSVDVFVRKVRRKLAAVSPGWVYIHTHFGIGYRFAPERVAASRPRGQRGIRR